jgi:Flp pilus assembly protein TadB
MAGANRTGFVIYESDGCPLASVSTMSRRSARPDRAGRGEGRRAGRKELSVGFVFAAWIVFFALWVVTGSLLIAAIVLGVLLAIGAGSFRFF